MDEVLPAADETLYGVLWRWEKHKDYQGWVQYDVAVPFGDVARYLERRHEPDIPLTVIAKTEARFLDVNQGRVGPGSQAQSKPRDH